MITRQSLGKFSIVAFLTLLIWVWADLSQDVAFTREKVPITINNDSAAGWWMAFIRPEDSKLVHTIYLDELVLKGPVGTVQRLQQERSLDLGLSVTPDGLGGEGTQVFNLLAFLREHQGIRSRGVSVVSCRPATVRVQVVRMVPAQVPVRCYDRNNQPLQATIEPDHIETQVPAEWSVESREAKVRLTDEEIVQARAGAIERKPFVEVRPNQPLIATQSVKVQLAPEEGRLKPFQIKGVARAAYLIGIGIQDRFRVVLDEQDLAGMISLIKIRATPEAKAAYEAQPYHVIIEITDATAGSHTVALKYNFPVEYVRRGEIELAQDPSQATYQLVPLETPETAGAN